MISRRTFLKRAIATGVVAAVAPSLLKKLPEALPSPLPDTPTIFLESTASGMDGWVRESFLTHAQLQAAYKDVVFGYDAPDLIYTNLRTYRLFTRLYDDPRYQGEFFHCSEVASFPKEGIL